MPSITYFEMVVGHDDRRQELGTTNYDNEFIPMYADASGHLNADFVETLNDERMTSFNVRLQSGFATLRKENFRIVDGKSIFYWYAYKKVKGKLNKTYVGLTDNLTEEILEAAIEKVNKPKEVTQNECVTKETKAIAPDVSIELAGNGKSSNHLQPNLIPVNQEISMLRDEIEYLKRLVQQGTEQNIVLHEEKRDVQRDRLAIIRQRDAIAKEFAEYKDKHRNVGLAVAVSVERAREQEETIKRQADLIFALRERNDGLQELHREALECISKLEEQVKDEKYNFACCSNIYEREADKVAEYRTLIEKYRMLAEGKDKRNHPRFAYMIDFLAEIDKLS